MKENILKKLIFFTILLAPTYLVRFEVAGLPFNLLEFFILLTFFSWILESHGKIKNKTTLKPFFVSVFLLLLGLIISITFNDNKLNGLGILKGWFLLPLLFSFLTTQVKDSSRILPWAIFLSTLVVSIISLTYLFLGELTYDNRLSAFYLSPNHLAMYLAPGVFIGAYFWKKHSQYKKILTISLVLILVPLYFTYSYAAWVAIFLSLIVINFIYTKEFPKITSPYAYTSIILLLVLASLISAQYNSSKFQDLITFSDRSSLASRLMIWESSFKIIQDNWILGIGPGNFQTAYLEYQRHFPPYLEWAVPQPHNLYLAFWLQTGLVGLLGFFWLILIWLQEINKKGLFSKALLGILFYFLLHGLIDTPYWKNDLAFIFWIIISLGVSLNYRKTLYR